MIPPYAPSVPDWMRTVASKVNPLLALFRSDESQKQPRLVIQDSDFPAFVGSEPNTGLSVYARNNTENGKGKAGVYSFMVNGTGNMVPFSTIGGTDCLALSGVVYSGEDAPNSVCVGNIVSRFAGAPPGINWGNETDMNNETPTAYTAGDARYGWAYVANTGSTYSPDTAFVAQRSPGEGTGPGYKQGFWAKGVRDSAFIAEAMSTATAPGMSPAATATLTAFIARVGGEAFNRFTVNESGRMDWGDGAHAQDIYLARVSGGLATNGTMAAIQYWIGSTPVLGQYTASFTEIAAASVPTPSAGMQTLFFDTADHKLKRKDSSGTVTAIA